MKSFVWIEYGVAVERASSLEKERRRRRRRRRERKRERESETERRQTRDLCDSRLVHSVSQFPRILTKETQKETTTTSSTDVESSRVEEEDEVVEKCASEISTIQTYHTTSTRDRPTALAEDPDRARISGFGTGVRLSDSVWGVLMGLPAAGFRQPPMGITSSRTGSTCAYVHIK